MFTDAMRVPLAVAVGLALNASPAWADDDEEVLEFDEVNVYIEINATDGDAGLHGIFDADAWEETEVKNEEGDTVLEVEADGALKDQGLTETFFESAEPLCREDEDEPGERVVSLGEFLERFPEGTYTFEGETIEGDEIEGEAELTHNLPAEPDITYFDGTQVMWAPGSDLGECSEAGIEPAPTGDIVAWEVAVEPADDEVEPLLVFSVQLGPDARMVTFPLAYLNSYPAGTLFKVEVGAIEESGNRTFSEVEQEED